MRVYGVILKLKTVSQLLLRLPTTNSRTVFNVAAWQAQYNGSRMMKPSIVFVLGGPGAGKGTQCEKIVEAFGFTHLSAGDLLRAERRKPDSKVGELIESHIREGTIVPVEITCSLLDKAITESAGKTFLIDGFPRNQDNLDGWRREMSNKVNVEFVVFFECPEEVCTARCIGRGQAGSGRSDDNPESLKKRFETYMRSTMPIVDYYRERGMVRTVDASQTPDQVFESVRIIFEKFKNAS